MAERVGVSVQTVSNYVNGRYQLMTTDTQERVAAALEELGYYPNSVARGLRSLKSRTLAFLLLDEHARFLADPLTDLLLAGMGDVVRDHQYGILVQAARPGDDPSTLLRPLLESQVDGAFLLMSGPRARRRAVVKRLKLMNAAFVVFDEPIRDREVLSVRADERTGARRLTDYLLNRGHTRIAFIAARVPWAVVEQRHAGYLAALRAKGVEPRPELQRFEAGWEPDGGAEITERLLDQDEPPTAIVCGSDLLAIGAIAAVRARGLEIPHDVAVSGFDDFVFSRFATPPLTTVSIPAYDMGATAAGMLLDLLEDREPAQRHVKFPVAVRLRESA